VPHLLVTFSLSLVFRIVFVIVVLIAIVNHDAVVVDAFNKGTRGAG
jgi:hypothetical protein